VVLNGVITTKIEICNGCNYVIPGNIIDRILFNGEGRFLLEIQNNKIDEFYQFNNNKMLYLSDIGQFISTILNRKCGCTWISLQH